MSSVNTTIPPIKNRFDLPFLGYGLGLRTIHYSHILNQKPAIDWFEIISENFMDAGGKPRRILGEIKEHYPIVMHGVGMSIGSTDPLNAHYMQQLKALADWVQPQWISDHLCWTGIEKKNSHDLLPVPYTEEALTHIIKKIKQAQDYMERPLLFENPSTYLEFADSSISEADFIACMVKEANCGLLLDVNNIYVTCYNHRLDPKAYIDALPLEHVVQIHLAGHHHKETHIIDTHDHPVIDEVWTLYQYVIAKTGEISTMVEWDDQIPEFERLEQEIDKARCIAQKAVIPNDMPDLSATPHNQQHPQEATEFYQQLSTMQTAILKDHPLNLSPDEWIRPKKDFSPQDQLNVYINGYRYRLFNVTYEDYPIVRHYLGKKRFSKLLWQYIEHSYSDSYNIGHFTSQFPHFIGKNLDNIGKDGAFIRDLALVEATIEQYFARPEQSHIIDQKALQGLNPKQFMQLDIRLKDSACLLSLDYDINSVIKRYHQQKEDRLPINLPEATPSYLLLYRQQEEIWRLPLEQNEHLMLHYMNQGNNIEKSLEIMLDHLTNEEEATQLLSQLQSWFSRWVNESVLAYR